MIGNVINKERYQILTTTPNPSGYPIPFKYWHETQISAIVTDSDGLELVVDPIDYSVTAPGDSGTLTFGGGYSFAPEVVVLTIVRSVTIEQQTDYRNGDILDAEVLESSLDALTAMLQETNERLDRTVRIPISDQASSLQMPSAEIRKNMLLGFDNQGNIIPILTSEIDQKLSQALAAELSVLSMYNNAGMVAVRTDMADPQTSKIQAVANNKTNIDTVANDIANVNAVGQNIVNVSAVANNAANINAVKTNETNINAVNANKANIDNVAGNKANIDKVAAIDTKIVAVEANEANINTVAADLDLGNSSSINIVANDKANIDAVAANQANINAVNANKTNIDAVANNAANINAVKNNESNINAVNANKTNIDAVKNNESNINAVNANKSNIDTVAGDKTNIDTVASNITDVGTIANNITDIGTVATDIAKVNNVSANIAAVNDAHTHMQAIIDAPLEASDAAQAKADAEAARDKAHDWAEEAEDVEVETGEYSSKHWATKAAASATSAHLADAAANAQVMVEGILYQWGLVYDNGHLGIKFVEVV